MIPGTDSTLCFPDGRKTCFACCPPIRPATYEHIQFKNMIRRVLRENTASFDRQDRSVIPIRGYSCWALGYLDRTCKTIGCLVHPALNRGVDLRFRIAYGDKCRRESCPEALIFSRLDAREKTFWLRLADGLDSFSYSSRKANPLLDLLGWGSCLLGLVPSVEAPRTFTGESFFAAYPFFSTKVKPRANAYLINHLVRRENLHILQEECFREEFERFSARIEDLLTRLRPHQGTAEPYVHRLPVDPDFLNLLRLSAHVPRLSLEGVLRLKDLVDKELDQFRSSLL